MDGERTKMRPGDLVLTPSWKFHDHANTGDTPVVWMDGLDLPIVNLFDSSFAEQYQQKSQPLRRAEGDGLVRYGANLLPIECKAESLASPVVNYPYAQCRRALEELRRNGPIDRYHGVKMQYSNPVTGGYPTPTMAAFSAVAACWISRLDLSVDGLDGLLRRGRPGMYANWGCFFYLATA